MFYHKLAGQDADISKCIPSAADKAMFESAKHVAQVIASFSANAHGT
jgi:hypothetical protein